MTPRPARAPSNIELGLFFLGAALCLSFLQSVVSPVYVILAAALVTAVRFAAARTGSSRRASRVLAWLAWAVVVALHVLWIYFCVTWGTHLAWTTAWWVRALAAALLVGVVATLRRPAGRIRVPPSLPMGVWISACLFGWLREEGFARCDDYRRLVSQAGIEVLPTRPELARCSAGDVLPIGRYPRKTWESPDGGRYVMTTQAGARFDSINPPAGAYSGVFCEAAADLSTAPRCVGGPRGKAHGILDVEPLGQLFLFAWSLPNAAGRKDSAVFRVPRARPLEILGERHFEGSVADGFYQPASDELRLITDECDPIRSVRGSDFSALPDVPVNSCWGEMRYDPQRDEGLWCGGVTGPIVAFRANPFSYRVLAHSGSPAGRVFMTWGCDWDPEHRRVYAAVPNLGVLATIDYGTGRIERQDFVGFGMRSVAFDAARGRAYLTDFLGGDVLAIDVASGREVARWFAGRFVREVRLTRDGKALLTPSNMGLVRIRIDPR